MSEALPDDPSRLASALEGWAGSDASMAAVRLVEAAERDVGLSAAALDALEDTTASGLLFLTVVEQGRLDLAAALVGSMTSANAAGVVALLSELPRPLALETAGQIVGSLGESEPAQAVRLLRRMDNQRQVSTLLASAQQHHPQGVQAIQQQEASATQAEPEGYASVMAWLVANPGYLDEPDEVARQLVAWAGGNDEVVRLEAAGVLLTLGGVHGMSALPARADQIGGIVASLYHLEPAVTLDVVADLLVGDPALAGQALFGLVATHPDVVADVVEDAAPSVVARVLQAWDPQLIAQVLAKVDAGKVGPVVDQMLARDPDRGSHLVLALAGIKPGIVSRWVNGVEPSVAARVLQAGDPKTIADALNRVAYGKVGPVVVALLNQDGGPQLVLALAGIKPSIVALWVEHVAPGVVARVLQAWDPQLIAKVLDEVDDGKKELVREALDALKGT